MKLGIHYSSFKTFFSKTFLSLCLYRETREAPEIDAERVFYPPVSKLEQDIKQKQKNTTKTIQVWSKTRIKWGNDSYGNKLIFLNSARRCTLFRRTFDHWCVHVLSPALSVDSRKNNYVFKLKFFLLCQIEAILKPYPFSETRPLFLFWKRFCSTTNTLLGGAMSQS